MHSKHSDLVRKDHFTEDELAKPSTESAKEEIEATRAALDKLINAKISAARPTHTDLRQHKPVTVRYQSGRTNASHASGASSRLIKIYEMPVDPLDPPKFRHKKLPARPPSPPVPIMHSPPRQVTVEDQKNWKVPPCVSNWKNNKGFTLPLHQRLAADGRGLYNHVINDKFAKFSEALLIAERQARKEGEARAQMRLKVSKKEKEQKEGELAEMAKQAKEAAQFTNTYGPPTSEKQRDTSSVYDANAAREHNAKERSRKRGREDGNENSSDSDSDSSSDESDDGGRDKAFAERERIRKERERERRREYRLDQRKGGNKESARQRERDISEKIALGQFRGKKSSESLYDNRLFNQSSGLNTGFAADDSYALYDKALFGHKARRLYRPTAMDDDVYGAPMDDALAEKSGRMRPSKGFDGAEANRNRGRNGKGFEFEKESSDEETERAEEKGKDALGDMIGGMAKERERRGGGGDGDENGQHR